MRIFLSILSVLCGFTLVGGFFVLYFWVPRWKAVANGYGTWLSSGEVLLITVSDLTVSYFYIVFPGVLVACLFLCRIAFAEDGKSSDAEVRTQSTRP